MGYIVEGTDVLSARSIQTGELLPVRSYKDVASGEDIIVVIDGDELCPIRLHEKLLNSSDWKASLGISLTGHPLDAVRKLKTQSELDEIKGKTTKISGPDITALSI